MGSESRPSTIDSSASTISGFEEDRVYTLITLFNLLGSVGAHLESWRHHLEMAGTTSSEGSNAMLEIDTSLKRNSEDVGWEFGALVNPSNVDKVKCKLCGKALSGGIHRLKQHIAHIKGNAAPCNKSSDEDKKKCKLAIEEAQSKKK
ncbi:hypothetical protein ACLB2K_038421 [Fragaria x ananassa]